MKRSNTKNLRVIYEDNHLIAVNKYPGDIVQGDKTNDAPLVEIVRTWIKEKYNKPGNVFCGLIHRIDRPVSGVVLFAKTSKALSRMDQMFASREVQKTYWSIVESKPTKNEATLVDWLMRNRQNNKSYVTQKKEKPAKKSELIYRLVGQGERYYYLEVLPKTGRHHQIRVQLSNNGTVIKGDLKYGAKRSNKDASICLHARQVEFIHPVSKESIQIVAPPPEDALWNDFLEKISL